MNKNMFLILLTLAAPGTVFGDCKVIETAEKFEVVCSSKETSKKTAPKTQKKKAVNASKTPDKLNSVTIMSDEEKRIMALQNSRDGYRSKQKPGEKTKEKKDVGVTKGAK